MSFLNVRRVAFDTETTGVDPTEDRIVTAALVARGGGAPDRVQSWLINPGVPIPAAAAEIHGVDDARAQAEGSNPKQALDVIASTLSNVLQHGLPVVAYNAAFDWSVLHYELERHGLPTMADRLGDKVPVLVDPLVLDKQCNRYVKGSGARKLKPTAERYGVELDDWHTADADALAALLIAEAQFQQYPQLADMGPQQLYAAQKAWRAEQQAGLQQWFRTKASPEQGGDPNKVIDGSWPLIPAQRGETK
jgi:DNA polymerase-3 subunit epsilon